MVFKMAIAVFAK